MSAVLLGLGSNLGDREAHLGAGLAALAATPGLTFRAASGLYETEPVGGPPQGAFLNACAVFDVTLEPADVLACLQAAEAAAGRERSVPDGPRTLDVDLLLHDERVVDEPGLRIPHPRLAERAFVLAPACDVAAAWRHPLLRLTLAALERRLRPHAGVRRLAATWSQAWA